MKHLTAAALILAMVFSAKNTIAQTGKPFTINAQLPANASGYVSYRYLHSDGNWRFDSVLMQGGRFQVKGMIPHPVIMRLEYAGKEKEMFIDPVVMTLTSPTTEIRNAKLTGSKTQLEFAEWDLAHQKIEYRWRTVKDSMMAISRRSNFAFQELKGWVLQPYFDEITEASLDFFDKHPASYVTAFNLQIEERHLSTDSLRLFLSRFPQFLKQSVYGKNLQDKLNKRSIAMPGTQAPVFTKKDIDGKTFSLASLRGKYVIVDFWGSWCLPCRKGNPHLIELYRKYKAQGLEIVGVAADDDTQAAWRAAVQQDGLLWLQVLQGKEPATDLGKLYNIRSYPTKFLLDKEGKIIGRWGEAHEELDRMLEKIFK